MAMATRRTVTIDELLSLLQQLSRAPIPAEVIERRREPSATSKQVVDELEPLVGKVIKFDWNLRAKPATGTPVAMFYDIRKYRGREPQDTRQCEDARGNAVHDHAVEHPPCGPLPPRHEAHPGRGDDGADGGGGEEVVLIAQAFLRSGHRDGLSRLR
jgi:hypothetical protein